MTNPMTKTARELGSMVSSAVLACALALSAPACGSSDPDANSGGDAYRNEAQAMPLDELVTGEIDADGGDQTDWKSIEIGEAGKLTLELSTDKKGAAIVVGLYDKYGALVDSDTKPGGSEDALKLKVKVKDGRYFVRIQEKGGGKTTYSVKASMGDGGGGSASPDI